MSIFKKIFGQKESNPPAGPRLGDQAKAGSEQGPKMIRLFDEYGREVQMTREEWRTKVLPLNLKKAWDQPDGLYRMIVSALNDGFRADVIEASRRLYQIDSDPVRGALIWGVVLREEDRWDEAEKVFQEVTSRCGEKSIIFANLARVYAKRGNEAKAEELLWHALELDPNQPNAMGWYEASLRERGGKEAGLEALRRVAALPGSWRARLWLARAELEGRRLDGALALYQEALALAPSPVPADLLMQMSGDLGNNGHVPEIITLCEPHFSTAHHGLQVGNNLIKAHLDLGQLDAAGQILNQLYALKRPDWQQSLSYWDTAIAQARVELNNPPPSNLRMEMVVLKGPVWLREGSPALSLFSPKEAGSPVVAFLGSSINTGETQTKQTLSDTAGRISRALPLFLAEQIHLTTSGVGLAVTPWVTDGGGGSGFAVSGVAWKADEYCDRARETEPKADYLVAFHIGATEEPWKVEATVYRTIDRAVLDSARANFTSAQPETAFVYLAQEVCAILQREAGLGPVANPLYQTPPGADFPFYLLRLEQAL
ncbi:MAG TPA: tetratricopeptide repeat protein, partial [Candidatus Methylacidiphilales bacterium]|nr:tetratricopeptide repeat protein [Candidatus Methylacidiphilales bacterium]